MKLDIGKNVKHFRDAAGLTVTDLSKKAKLSQPQISRIEGNTQGLRSGTALRLAKALGVHPFVFFMTSEQLEAARTHIGIYVKKTIFG